MFIILSLNHFLSYIIHFHSSSPPFMSSPLLVLMGLKLSPIPTSTSVNHCTLNTFHQASL